MYMYSYTLLATTVHYVTTPHFVKTGTFRDTKFMTRWKLPYNIPFLHTENQAEGVFVSEDFATCINYRA